MNKNIYRIVENAVRRALTENIHDEIDAAWERFNAGGDEHGDFESEYIYECVSRNLKKSLRHFKLI